jgi:hypothetical protein
MSRQNDRLFDDPNVIPFLDLDQLKKEERNTFNTQKKIFKLILSRCHDRIKKRNRDTDLRECYYEVPIMLPGYPGYNLNEVCRFIVVSLGQNGLKAQVVDTGKIYISWKPQDINRRQYETRVDAITPKPNLYKVGVSPMADQYDQEMESNRPRKPVYHKKSKNSEDEPQTVSMLQYDDKLPDLIPVNRRKAERMYHYDD